MLDKLELMRLMLLSMAIRIKGRRDVRDMCSVKVVHWGLESEQ